MSAAYMILLLIICYWVGKVIGTELAERKNRAEGVR